MFLWEGDSSWYFVALPKDLSEDLNALFGDHRRGFGSLPVEVSIGATVWRTSLFSDSKRGTFLLPLKASVRKAEGISEGLTVKTSFEIC